jgi:hypothetical protein
MLIKSLFARLIGILVRPKQEWPVIHGEAAEEPNDIIRDYAFPLILICDLAMLVGLGESRHSVIIYGIAGFVLPILVLSLTSGILFSLASKYDGQTDRVAVTKLVAYSSSPIWLAMMFEASKMFSSALWLCGMLYGLVLYWIGLPVILKIPDEKRRVFFRILVLVVTFSNGISILILSAIRRLFVVGVG